jgi:hypothetical protein
MFREEPQAFVSLSQEPASPELRRIIEETLKEASVVPVSIDRINDPTVVAGIQNRIRETDYVIADVTGADPNVMIEVGMAIGMGKRLLLLASTRSSQLPVDLLALQVAVYRADHLDAVKRYLQLWLRDELSEREAFRAS